MFKYNKRKDLTPEQVQFYASCRANAPFDDLDVHQRLIREQELENKAIVIRAQKAEQEAIQAALKASLEDVKESVPSANKPTSQSASSVFVEDASDDEEEMVQEQTAKKDDINKAAAKKESVKQNPQEQTDKKESTQNAEPKKEPAKKSAKSKAKAAPKKSIFSRIVGALITPQKASSSDTDANEKTKNEPDASADSMDTKTHETAEINEVHPALSRFSQNAMLGIGTAALSLAATGAYLMMRQADGLDENDDIIPKSDAHLPTPPAGGVKTQADEAANVIAQKDDDLELGNDDVEEEDRCQLR